MKIEIITVGDEILSGAITDTNFAWLGEQLWSRGYEVHWHTSVRDEPEDISKALLAAVGRSKAVIVTGGLGPTSDDITVEVAAKTFDLKLALNEEALQTIKERFQKIGREMTPNNEKQAWFPEGSRMIVNRAGTAPGCHVVFKDTHFFFTPGVPREMKQQFEDDILETLTDLDSEKRQFAFRLLRCFGLPESTIGQKLENINLEGIDLAYRVFFPEILLKVSAWGIDLSKIEARVQEVVTEIKSRLGDIVYCEGDEALPAVVGSLLVKENATISVAESCTGGRLASLLTDVSGSSRYFDRGVVTYSNNSKKELLGVPAETLEKFRAVSRETAIAMAQGIRKLSKTTYSLSITGIAGPDGGTPEKPVGTVHIALDSDNGTQERKLHFATNREWFKLVVSFAALDLLRKTILKK